MKSDQKQSKQLMVSFSGVDGAGKSTQIAALCTRMRERGLKVKLITFWDDVARLKRFREGAGHALLKGDKGIGSPSAPIHRKDKNVQSWPMTLFRLFLYTFDAVSVRAKVREVAQSDADVVVFDRYIYDELANLPLSNSLVRGFVRSLMRYVPRPEISYILDADPVQARARKPEYPLDFVYKNRKAYMDLSTFLGGMTIVKPMPIESVQREVLAHADAMLFQKNLLRRPRHSAEASLATSIEEAQIHPAAL